MQVPAELAAPEDSAAAAHSVVEEPPLLPGAQPGGGLDEATPLLAAANMPSARRLDEPAHGMGETVDTASEHSDRIHAWLSSSNPHSGSGGRSATNDAPPLPGSSDAPGVAPGLAPASRQRMLAGAFEDSDIAGPEGLGPFTTSASSSRATDALAPGSPKVGDSGSEQVASRLDDQLGKVMEFLASRVGRLSQAEAAADGLVPSDTAWPSRPPLSPRVSSDLAEVLARLQQPRRQDSGAALELHVAGRRASEALGENPAAAPAVLAQPLLPADEQSVAALQSNVQRVFFRNGRAAVAATSETSDGGGESSTTLQLAEDDKSQMSSQASLVTPLWMHDHKKGYTGAPKPTNEQARMARLCSLGVLSTEAELRFDRLTNFVARVRQRRCRFFGHSMNGSKRFSAALRSCTRCVIRREL